MDDGDNECRRCNPTCKGDCEECERGEPTPDTPGYAPWDENLSLRDTIRAYDTTIGDIERDATRQGILLGNVILEFREGIRLLNARCDRIEAALVAVGRPLPRATGQASLFPEETS